MNQKKIGEFIAKCRKAQKLTQEELAQKIGTTSRMIGIWENGDDIPEQSLIKPLCEELNITTNDLFSGEKVRRKNCKEKSNETLEEVLSEYYQVKSKKNKMELIIVLIVFLLVIIVVGFFAILSITSPRLLKPADVRNGLENYDKKYYIKEYGHDIDTNLSIFPDDETKFFDATFLSSLDRDLFDTNGYIILQVSYDEREFKREIERISSLSMTINEKCYPNSKTFINNVKYDKDSYDYPAYITIDGFANVYEYALVDKEKLKITYVYLAYPNVKNKVYAEYLKKDKNEYSKSNTLGQFSMYNHSFDKGKSFVEHDE